MVKLAEIDPVTQEITHYEGSRMHRAVVKAAEALQARPFMPELGDRILKAMDLMLTGKVTYQGRNVYQVQSGSHTYQVDTEAGCPCKFSEHQSTWCKHAVAVELHQQAHTLLASGNGRMPEPEPAEALEAAEAQAPDRPPAPQPQAAPDWRAVQAPIIHTVKIQVDGIEHVTVIRGDTLAEVLEQVKAVTTQLKQARAHYREAAAQAAQVAEAAPQARTAPAYPSCPDHGSSRLKPSKYGDGVFCSGRSRKGDGSYCAYSWKPQA